VPASLSLLRASRTHLSACHCSSPRHQGSTYPGYKYKLQYSDHTLTSVQHTVLGVVPSPRLLACCRKHEAEGGRGITIDGQLDYCPFFFFCWASWDTIEFSRCAVRPVSPLCFAHSFSFFHRCLSTIRVSVHEIDTYHLLYSYTTPPLVNTGTEVLLMEKNTSLGCHKQVVSTLEVATLLSTFRVARRLFCWEHQAKQRQQQGRNGLQNLLPARIGNPFLKINTELWPSFCFL